MHTWRVKRARTRDARPIRTASPTTPCGRRTSWCVARPDAYDSSDDTHSLSAGGGGGATVAREVPGADDADAAAARVVGK